MNGPMVNILFMIDDFDDSSNSLYLRAKFFLKGINKRHRCLNKEQDYFQL